MESARVLYVLILSFDSSVSRNITHRVNTLRIILMFNPFSIQAKNKSHLPVSLLISRLNPLWINNNLFHDIIFLDLIDNIQSFYYFTKHCVIPIKVSRIFTAMANEEL